MNSFIEKDHVMNQFIGMVSKKGQKYNFNNDKTSHSRQYSKLKLKIFYIIIVAVINAKIIQMEVF